MRFAIYALTFLTYAYSGYGSNVIHNLRDAIIAAEAVFGDFFKNIIHLSKKFQTVHQVFNAAVEETCVFKCAGGKSGTECARKYFRIFTTSESNQIHIYSCELQIRKKKTLLRL